MTVADRPIAFVLAASDHGAMIVNRLDVHRPRQGGAYGVGFELLESGAYAPTDVNFFLRVLRLRRASFGDGVVAVDCGANIGTHAIEWAKAMTGWGTVTAIEVQERIFYALAGNIVLNNCGNARATHAAVSSRCGVLRAPVPDYSREGSFGSLEVRPSRHNEDIGQPIDYRKSATTEVASLTIDSLGLSRLDFLKIDVEGMELEVLQGASATLAACRPVIVAEHIKVGRESLAAIIMPMGYRLGIMPMNIVAVHQDDPLHDAVLGDAAITKWGTDNAAPRSVVS